MKTYFTSESVTEGHPDKIADQISDGILDAIIAQDKNAHVACEVLVSTGLVLISGEITTDCYVDVQKIARKTICDIGYNHGDMKFDGNSCAVLTAIDEQSPDIAQGVNKKDQGAGDQGIMFGFACDETPELMPVPIVMAHKLAHKLSELRQSGALPYLRPDGKSQVTFEYTDGVPTRVSAVVLSAQHAPEVSQEQIRKDLEAQCIREVLGDKMDKNTILHINPTGKFVIGGPQGDCGMTGRKIIVDTYGGFSRHGGGAFSGKDPSKTDRSGAYMARYVAKNLVANKFAQKCEVQLAYAIGVAEPVSIFVETFGTSEKNHEELEHIIRKNFDLTPRGIIETLDLLRPIYAQTATYGHFGRLDLGLPWEKVKTMKNGEGRMKNRKNFVIF
ncbi:methionine adenosyltransferase [Candidatus Gracilibacteria bacterium]|nr:methionine adenosyltransferase [Candidatus Gracilibacteria bacterium]